MGIHGATNLFLRVLLSFLAGLAFIPLHAQEVPGIGYFNLTSGGGKVYLSWQLEPGATCFGIQVHRSADGDTFEAIGGIEGVCGDLTKPVSYSFVDETPPRNQRVWYRLELGTNNFTEIRYVDVIDLQGEPVQVRPNPVTDRARIFFTNASRDNHHLMISTINGQVVMRASTREDHFIINASYFAAGTYIFSIRPEGNPEALTGKLLILR